MGNNELMHYGVLGMKWGVRKARKTSSKVSRRIKKKNKLSSDKPQTPKKKAIKDMSDDELRKAINRLEMEKRYRDLSPKQVSKGKQFVSDFMSKAIVPAINEAGKNLARDYLTKIGKKKLGLDIKDNEQAYIDRLSKEVKKMNLENTYKDLRAKREEAHSKAKETETINKVKDEYSKRVMNGDAPNDSKYRKSGDEIVDRIFEINPNKKNNTTSFRDTPVSDIKNSDRYLVGKSYISGFLEDKKRK